MDKRCLKNTLFNMIQAVKRQHLIRSHYTRAISLVCVWAQTRFIDALPPNRRLSWISVFVGLLEVSDVQ